MTWRSKVSGQLIAACLGLSGCDALLGKVEVVRGPATGEVATPTPAPALPFEPGLGGGEVGPPPAPPQGGEGIGVLPLDAGVGAGSADVPAVDPPEGPDAAMVPPPEPVPDAGLTSLERVVRPDAAIVVVDRTGVDGGSPRLGTCVAGLVVGIRPTANPGDGVFGQRLTFLEPICGRVTLTEEVSVLGVAAARELQVTRDDALLGWSEEEPFLGLPPTDIPDSRLIWEQQPEAVCPVDAPVLVGLAGRYDPVAPDANDTAAFRSLELECAPLEVSAAGAQVTVAGSGHQLIAPTEGFASTGSESYAASCPPGGALTQLLIHSGFWLDGFSLGCAALRTLRGIGETCVAGDECGSGRCSDDGVCVASLP